MLNRVRVAMISKNEPVNSALQWVSNWKLLVHPCGCDHTSHAVVGLLITEVCQEFGKISENRTGGRGSLLSSGLSGSIHVTLGTFYEFEA